MKFARQRRIKGAAGMGHDDGIGVEFDEHDGYETGHKKLVGP
jgi:hypothetical protein